MWPPPCRPRPEERHSPVLEAKRALAQSQGRGDSPGSTGQGVDGGRGRPTHGAPVPSPTSEGAASSALPPRAARSLGHGGPTRRPARLGPGSQALPRGKGPRAARGCASGGRSFRFPRQEAETRGRTRGARPTPVHEPPRGLPQTVRRAHGPDARPPPPAARPARREPGGPAPSRGTRGEAQAGRGRRAPGGGYRDKKQGYRAAGGVRAARKGRGQQGACARRVPGCSTATKRAELAAGSEGKAGSGPSISPRVSRVQPPGGVPRRSHVT